MRTISAAQLVTGTALWAPGWVTVDDVGGRVLDAGSGPPPWPADENIDAVLVPGYVDIHCHGGGAASFSDGAQAARTVIDTHRRFGTTSIMASLVTESIQELADQVDDLRPLVESGELLGVHLEGPWLSAAKRGSHSLELLVEPRRADVATLLRSGAVRMVTLAPELEGAVGAIQQCVDAGVVAAVGHTAASYHEVQAAIRAGATVGTHVFNAMRAIHHREPGPVLALLTSDAFLEVIADGVHLDPVVVRYLLDTCPDRAVLVTDAMAAAGAVDGYYELGHLHVTVVGGRATISGSGAITGSTLTMADAVKFAVTQAGVALDSAIRAATLNPAKVLGLADRGRIAAGARADFAVLDPVSLDVVATFVAGRPG